MEEKQRAVIVGVNTGNEFEFIDSMKELEGLAEACDIEVVGEVTQNLDSFNIGYYVGTGKVEEILSIAEDNEATTIIFNDELSMNQITNLENKLGMRIIDRTFLILEIFSERAKTKEAKLQVELAQLEYMLPRLLGLGRSLGHQGGGSGLRNRGAGEKKIELGRRRIRERINVLEKELEALTHDRKIQRKRRIKKEIYTVALVGYTNAGKSTIMNHMIGSYGQSEDKKVFEKDMLFATLETSVRNIALPDKKQFILTDTVGFISKLPHHLIKAFRSTLEEVTEADLLIHVVDYSNPMYENHIKVTNKTLKELGAKDIPMIYAYNKIDLTDGTHQKTAEDSVYISAKRDEGMDTLLNKIYEKIFADYVKCEMLIPYDKGNIVSYLKEHANVKELNYEAEGARLSLECKKSDYEKYKEYEI